MKTQKKYNYRKSNLKLLVVGLIVVIFLFFIPLIGLFVISLTGDSFGQAYRYFFGQKQFVDVFFHSFYLSFMTTVICLFVGYIIAMFIYYLDNRFSKKTIIAFILMPLFLNSLIKVLSIQAFLLPLKLIGTNFALIVGLIYLYIPYMIIVIYNGLIIIDKEIVNSSYSLGASKFQTFIKIILPLSIPAIITGIILVFLPCITSVIIPNFLGNDQNHTIGNVIVNLFSGSIKSLPTISAISFSAMAFVGVLILCLKVVGKILTKNKLGIKNA